MKIVAARPITFPMPADQRPVKTMDVSSVLPGYTELEADELRGDVFIAPRRFPLRPTRRLVVLVPEGSLDENALVHKIWRLASTSAMQVLFLGRSPDEESESSIRRRMALLAASLQRGQVSAGTSIAVRENWRQAVRNVLRDGDLLVCLARHKVAYRVFRHRSLGEALAAEFETPLYLLGELDVGQPVKRLQLMRSIVAWSLSSAILVAFAGLQIWISRNADSPLSSILLVLSIVAEGITLLKSTEWLG